MDPQATWTQLITAYRSGDDEAAREAAQALLDWLDREGFPPTIINVPDFDRMMVQAVCTYVLSNVSQGDESCS